MHAIPRTTAAHRTPFLLLLFGGLAFLAHPLAPTPLTFGPITLSAATTVGLLFLGLLLVVSDPRIARPVAGTLTPYTLFLVYAWLSILWAPASMYGVQNLVVFTLFLVSIMVVPLYPRILQGIERILPWVAVGTASAYMVFVAIDGPGNDLFFEPRPLSLFFLVLLGWFLPAVRFQATESRMERLRSLTLSGLLLLTIVLCLGRTTSGIALALIFINLFLNFRSPKPIIMIGIAALIGWLGLQYLIETSPVWAERFAGDDAVAVGGIDVNLAGRSILWSAALDSWSSTTVGAIIGQGAGSVAFALQLFRDEPHPHNEYIRILHDYGAIGLALWLAAFALLLTRLAKAFQAELDQKNGEGALICLRGLNGMLIILFSAITLNSIVYGFVMHPLGLWIGGALAWRYRRLNR